MNALIVAFFACIAVASASLTGLGLVAPGAVVAGPLGGGALLGVPGAGILGAPALGLGLGAGLGLNAGLGLGAGVVTRGGGVVGVSPLGATVAGPPTAPVSIIGPSGTVRANGLWGPTLAGVVGH